MPSLRRSPSARARSPLYASLLALAAAGCAGGGGIAPAASASAPLAPDVFPVEARESRFVTARGEPRVVTVERAGDGAVLRIAGGGRIDVRREGGSLVFASGPSSATELIRGGAAPGDEWPSGPAVVRFEGWERVTVPAGTFDAARVRTSEGPDTLRIVQTWWFARGTGLVRLRSDRGGVFSEEMSLAP